jgi:hypothetical protein
MRELLRLDRRDRSYSLDQAQAEFGPRRARWRRLRQPIDEETDE